MSISQQQQQQVMKMVSPSRLVEEASAILRASPYQGIDRHLHCHFQPLCLDLDLRHCPAPPPCKASIMTMQERHPNDEVEVQNNHSPSTPRTSAFIPPLEQFATFVLL